jgi:hypothetical protein
MEYGGTAHNRYVNNAGYVGSVPSDVQWSEELFERNALDNVANLKGGKNGNNYITVSWDGVTGTDRYQVLLPDGTETTTSTTSYTYFSRYSS